MIFPLSFAEGFILEFDKKRQQNEFKSKLAFAFLPYNVMLYLSIKDIFVHSNVRARQFIDVDKTK